MEEMTAEKEGLRPWPGGNPLAWHGEHTVQGCMENRNDFLEKRMGSNRSEGHTAASSCGLTPVTSLKKTLDKVSHLPCPFLYQN